MPWAVCGRGQNISMTIDLGFIIIPLTIWVAIGFLGQALFSMRFLVQWIVSEKLKKSVIPVAFWYFSVAGGVTLFIYALHREDPVFIFGQGLGLIIYFRNLVLVYRQKRLEKLMEPDRKDEAAVKDSQ
jgi:lipid-A-disaccharide synthase-like uncharacterized protein